MIGDDGEPLAPGRLPNRRAIVSGRPKRASSAIGSCRTGTNAGRSSARPRSLRRAATSTRDQRHPRRHGRAAARSGRARRRTGAVFAASIDIEATFDALAALLVPRFADYCIVDMVEDGRLRQVVIGTATRARAAAARAPRALPAGPRTRRIRSRRCWRPASRTSSRMHAQELSRRRRRRGASRPLPQPGGDLVHRRAARGTGPDARDDLARHRRVGQALRRPRPRARARARAASSARDRQRAPLRRGAAVVRAAEHAARLGAGRDRLLGPRPPLRAGQRRARHDQRALAGGARRPRPRRGRRRARAHARPALPACARDGRAGRAHRVDRRCGAPDGRSAATGSRATTRCTRPTAR